MDHSHSYERVLPLPKKGDHLWHCILIWGAYGLLALLGCLWFILTLDLYALALTALAELCLVLLTRKHLSVEYEYAFLGGVLTVAKILGKSRRRVIAEVELDRLLLADYLSPDALAAARLTGEKIPDARSLPAVSPALLLVYERENKSRGALILETDDTTERILRRAKPDACSMALKRGTPQSY